MRTVGCTNACLIINNLLRRVVPFEKTKELHNVGVLHQDEQHRTRKRVTPYILVESVSLK